MRDIYEFIDYRAFLAHWFVEKKKKRSTYSYRLFSRQMGQKSPSFLKDIIEKRRNITMAQFEPLCKILELRQREKNYLRHLIIFEHSKDSSEKNRAFELIAATHNTHNVTTLIQPSKINTPKGV